MTIPRRQLLAAAAAGIATSGATYAVSAGAPAPDPIFALLKAEERAWKAFDVANARFSKAEQAWLASPLHRRARVMVAVSVDFCRGPDFEPIPVEELVERPVYVYSREEIDENAKEYARFHDVTPEQVEARRLRMLADYEADMAAIANAPEAILCDQAEEESDRRSGEHLDAAHALLTIQPTTIPGLLALIDRIRVRSDSFVDEIEETLAHVAASARTLLSGRTA